MDNLDNIKKIALMSGKLSGTKTLLSVFDELEFPDDIEAFLKSFFNLKLKFNIEDEVIYINDDQDFLDHLASIEESNLISICPNASFNRLFITTDNKKNYIIRINKVSSGIIGKFISKDLPIKFSLNSFSFIKWCVSQNIDIRNIYDIPTYIKILTNEIDPFKTVCDYIKEYSEYELDEEDNEGTSLIMSNFIYEFGKFLREYAMKFDIDGVCKLINENSFCEAILSQKDEEDGCRILFSYKNLQEALDTIINEVSEKFKDKQYIISPLGRIAIKFGHNEVELIKDLYLEDMMMTILNEFYINNIHAEIVDENVYMAFCKYKNLNNVFALITATLNDVFYTMFRQTFEAEIRCEVRE